MTGRAVVAAVVVLCLQACAESPSAPIPDPTSPGHDDASLSRSAAAGRGMVVANVSVVQPSSSIAHLGVTPWALSKTGALETTTSTVTWEILVEPGATTARTLIINGQISIRNEGNAPATVGNIVVNLQHKPHVQWLTAASNVADAHLGDAATTTLIIDGTGVTTIAENAASGELTFVGAGGAFPSPIPPDTERTWHVTATFDNGVLALPVGQPVRAQIIVTTGNARPGNTSEPNVDIDSNGAIDGDEARVRSVATLLGELRVPAAIPTAAQVTLSDGIDDISTTGTVTFDNASFNLGATGGTVSVRYDAGADGGTITNCAKLKGIDIDLEACDTQTIPEPTTGCTPGTAGCGWLPGDMLTHPQISWDDGVGSQVLVAHYNAVYAASFGVLEIGLPGAAGFSLEFSGFAAVTDFFPTAGPAGVLNADLANPTSSSAGVFAGELLALRLNVDFADAGYIGGAANLVFGDLTLCGLAAAGLDGLSVRELLDIANAMLGGGFTGYALVDVAPIAGLLNSAFGDGGVSAFATAHLYSGACP